MLVWVAGVDRHYKSVPVECCHLLGYSAVYLYVTCFLLRLYGAIILKMLTFIAKAENVKSYCLSWFSVYLSVHIFDIFSLQRIGMSKLLELCDCFSEINFMIGCCSLNSTGALSISAFLMSQIKEYYMHIEIIILFDVL
jgi:hypothetical protein